MPAAHSAGLGKTEIALRWSLIRSASGTRLVRPPTTSPTIRRLVAGLAEPHSEMELMTSELILSRPWDCIDGNVALKSFQREPFDAPERCHDELDPQPIDRVPEGVREEQVYERHA